MLVEYSLTNFRSVKERQTLSLIATADKTFRDSNCVKTHFSKAKYVERSTAIYGPNAAGKSNFIFGMNVVWFLIHHPGLSLTAVPPLDAQFVPFAFDEEWSEKPSEIELTFIEDDVLFTYAFGFRKGGRIVKESLHAQEKRKLVLYYERKQDPKNPDKDLWNFGSALRGRKSLWAEATLPHQLLISTNASNMSEQLALPFKWLSTKIRTYTGLAPLPESFSQQLMDTEKQTFIEILKLADSSIVDAEWDEVGQQTLPLILPGGLTTVTQPLRQLKFIHEDFENHKRRRFDLVRDESAGLQRHYALAGNVIDGLRNGVTFFFDEVGTSLHPLLLKTIIRMFQDPTKNKHGAQLIFTTHDTAQLDTDSLFRRDQIWFMDRTPCLASRLYPLIDFSPRRQEAILKGYLSGRYGAVPSLE